jgi:superfamily II DNA or RNA helicase
MTTVFAPGDLVQARGREWVALPSSSPDLLCLRPLTGSEADIQLLDPTLEVEPVLPARFELPRIDDLATQDAGRLLAEALRLSLRRGAGPFRSASRVAFEPRAYQLVPLLMALRLPIIRLMIADDVGIGKTIEAGLILRELIDRGEVDRFSILCPPHLVEQWTAELKIKFDLDAVAVTASSAARLERGLAASQSLFEVHPYTVVSLDYIKAEKRRDSFARACPLFVIVDEAHACVGTHMGRQQRFELLKRLSEDEQRHLLLLTATPHSGDEDAFDRLLGLVDSEFSRDSMETDAGRRRLARHFVQRRRIDITGREWGEEQSFPKHLTAEKTYNFTAEHQAFHNAVLDYCLGVVEGAGADQHKRRLAFWSTLALMRCVGSSPSAALSTLRTRLSDIEVLEDQVCDEDEAEGLDVEPASVVADDEPLHTLIKQAELLVKAPDPKLDQIISVLRPLIAEAAHPIVFCRFIATAEHVATGLRKAFPKARIEAVTGLLTPEDRRARVESMADSEQRILVATDCLSEGINLQHLFDSVIHYDLSWNPTRHQQREGRVDRFGQPAKLVRSVLLFSPDSAIDGAVLDVILRKAEAIRAATGVTVPLPEERSAVAGALMNAVLLRKGRTEQLKLDFGIDLSNESAQMEARWRDAEEGERRSRARFAQNTIRPEEVAPEWQRWRSLLGGPAEVRRFVERAMSRLNAPLENGAGAVVLAHLDALPLALRERLAARGMEGSRHIVFEEPGPANTEVVVRSHPIPAILSDYLLEGALHQGDSTIPSLGRIGVWPTTAVQTTTTVVLLRLRFKLIVHGRRDKLLLVEEAGALAFVGNEPRTFHSGEEAFRLLESPASGNLAPIARDRFLAQAREQVQSALTDDGPIAAYSRERAAALLQDHDRVRSALSQTGGVPRVTVEPVLPADVVGLFVLIPGGV